MSAPAPARHSQAEVDKALSELPGWRVEGGKLHWDYTFVDFVATFRFMTGAALIAQGMNHHREGFNVYNRVHLDLATHESGGITALDVKRARVMEELADRQPPTCSRSPGPLRARDCQPLHCPQSWRRPMGVG